MKKSGLIINFSATERFPEISFALKSKIREAIEKTLLHEGFDYPSEVSVTLCSAEYIHALNKEYRGVDRPTDVLSLPMFEKEELTEENLALGAPLGDVVLSVPRTREQAAELGNSFEREIAFLTVHSILHLLGYDHERGKEDEELQCSAQREIIESMDFS